MALNLCPLVQLTTGQVHPSFPRTVLQYWLLTDTQLDELAHFYHQRTPCPLKFQYPCPITWHPDLPLEEKRRKMGKFIGLRGCESPASAGFQSCDGIRRGEYEERLEWTEDEGIKMWMPMTEGETAKYAKLAAMEGLQTGAWGFPPTEEQIAKRARAARIVDAEEELLMKKWYAQW
jgi:hypothetical protein